MLCEGAGDMSTPVEQFKILKTLRRAAGELGRGKAGVHAFEVGR